MADAYYPRLRKLAITTVRDTGVPTAGTCTFYKQGLIVRSGGSKNGTDQSIAVMQALRVIVGDTLVKESDIIAGTVSPPTATVDQVNSLEDIRADITNGPMSLSAGDRLIITNNQPTLYGDFAARATTANPITTDGTTGYGHVFIKERFVDVKVSASGMTTQVLRDEESGETGHVVNAMDFTSIKAAFQYCNMAGNSIDALYIPSGFHVIPSGDLPLTVSRGSFTVFGDGPHSTRLVKDVATKRLIDINGDYSKLHFKDMQLLDASGSTHASDGTCFYFSGTTRPTDLILENIWVYTGGTHGIHLENQNFPLFLNVTVQGSAYDGIRLVSAAQARFINCYINACGRYGLYCSGVNGFQWDGIGIEDCQTSGASGKTNSMAYMDSCDNAVFLRTDFEEFTGPNYALSLQNCRGVVIKGCQFPNGSYDSSTVGIWMGQGNVGFDIGANWFYNVGTGIEHDTVANVTTISSDGIYTPNSFTGSNAQRINLPPLADRYGQKITCIDGFGVILPVWNSGALPTPHADDEGAMLYKATTKTISVWTGAAWVDASALP